MFRLLIMFSLVLRIHSIESRCLLLTDKLKKYNIDLSEQENSFYQWTFCENATETSCCTKIDPDKIRNATMFELSHLFELNSMNLFELLNRLSIDTNQSMERLIDLSRNETYFLFEYSHKAFYPYSRIFIEKFFVNLFNLSSFQTYENLFKINLEHFLRIHPTKFHCLWQNLSSIDRFNRYMIQLESYRKNYFHIIELFQSNLRLIRALSTDLTKDHVCIQAYVELFICNLCSERRELPCQKNCIDMWQQCLKNVTMIDGIWRNFLDSLDNVRYFDEIETNFLSIGYELLQIIMSVFAEIRDRNMINQCGNMQLKREFFDIDQAFVSQYKNSSLISSIFRSQIMSIRQTLEEYKSFWFNLSNQMCQSNEKQCWKGRQKSSINHQPLQRALASSVERILNEIQSKSFRILSHSSTISKPVVLNDENDVDYSDYLYEDLIPQSTITTTTIIDNEDFNTVSYYDYDVYLDGDDDGDGYSISTEELANLTTTTFATPSYYHRTPIVWNLDFDNSGSSSRCLPSLFIFVYLKINSIMFLFDI